MDNLDPGEYSLDLGAPLESDWWKADSLIHRCLVSTRTTLGEPAAECYLVPGRHQCQCYELSAIVNTAEMSAGLRIRQSSVD